MIPGCSLLQELFANDYVSAQKYQEEQLELAIKMGRVSAIPTLYSNLGVVYLLQGQIDLARLNFRKAASGFGQNSRASLRLLNYQWLTETWEHDLFPDGNGARLKHSFEYWSRAERSKSMRVERMRCRQNLHLKTLEDLLIEEVLPIIYSHRASVRRAFSGHAAYLEQVLQMGLQHLSWALSQSDQLEGANASFKGYLYQLMADLSLRAGKESAVQHYLDEAISHYQEDECLPGIGTCLLLAGDQLAAPFSTPSAFNVELTDHLMELGSLRNVLSEQEWRNSKIDVSEAQAYYLEAKEFYEEAGASIGLGQVAHRTAYLNSIEGNFETALRHSMEAEELFKRAGDLRSYYLAQVHTHLMRIGAYGDQVDLPSSRKIGEWGRSSGNKSFTLGLGLLYCAMGWIWLQRENQPLKGDGCFRLATALFEGMGMHDRAAHCKLILKASNT